MTGRTVRDIGEFGLIKALREALPSGARGGRGIELGIGDDAAAWRPSEGESELVTTDSLVEGVHFRLEWTDWLSLGYKALAVNISDIAAMGGVPRLALISLGLTGDEQVANLTEMYQGIGDAAVRFGVVVVGGDVVRSPEEMAIHVTVIGETRGGQYLTRSGARPGDLISVSGTLGAAAAGLALLQLSLDDARRQTTTAEVLIGAHLRPEPRVDLGALLLKSGATAAMDLSDGLYGDLQKILSASDVSGSVDLALVPVAAAVRALFKDEYLAMATRGGEDYELLFTISPDLFEEIGREADAVGAQVTAIGEVVEKSADGPELIVRDMEGVERVENTGAFDHFRRV
jgi:thiamine-monophosphate kinase